LKRQLLPLKPDAPLEKVELMINTSTKTLFAPEATAQVLNTRSPGLQQHCKYKSFVILSLPKLASNLEGVLTH
jgi:hypothetical protein